MPKHLYGKIIIKKLPQDMTIQVKVDPVVYMHRSLRVRFWLAKQLLFLATWLMGVGLEIEQDGKAKEQESR